MIVIADACYSADRGPFVVVGRDLQRWIEAFNGNYQDEIFAGDAVMVFAKSALLVHHEGMWALARGA